MEPIIFPALKSWMIPSDSAATDAVTPLDTIDACSDPGATKPKTACVRFAIVEMGPQFVSPSTRRATRPSGRARRMASTECQTGVPKNADCAATRPVAETRAPSETQRSGRSPLVASAARSDRKVESSERHRSASVVMPPAMSAAMPGHMM